jgi:hypothetical protein
MAGLVPAIHVFLGSEKDVDARHKAGHDEGKIVPSSRRSTGVRFNLEN